jgi:hypothetical protein
MFRNIFVSLIFCFGLSVVAHSQQIDPSYQVNWANSTGCSTAGGSYNPQSNTCVVPLIPSPTGAQAVTQPSASQPLSVNYVSLGIVNGIPMVDQWCGNGVVGGVTQPACSADFCVKLRSAELYAIGNNLRLVDASHFSKTQSCSVDPFQSLATAGTTVPLAIILPAATIQYSFVDGNSNSITINNPGMQIVGQGRFNTIWQYVGTTAANYAFGTHGGNINGDFMMLRDFSVLGNSHVVNAISLENWHRSSLENVSAWGATGCGIYTPGAVTDTFIKPHVSGFDAALANPVWTSLQTPTCGIGMDAFSGNQTTSGTVIDGAFEGINGTGIKLLSANQMTFTGGTSEENTQGIVVSSGSKFNTFLGTDVEQNTLNATGVDLSDAGQQNYYINLIMASGAGGGFSANFTGSGGFIFGEAEIAHLWTGVVNVLGVTSFFAGNAAATTTMANMQVNAAGNVSGLLTAGGIQSTVFRATGTVAIAPGTGVTSAVCATGHTCTLGRGVVTVVNSTGTTGTIFTLTGFGVAPECTATEVDTAVYHAWGTAPVSSSVIGIGPSIALTAATYNVSYTCQQ